MDNVAVSIVSHADRRSPSRPAAGTTRCTPSPPHFAQSSMVWFCIDGHQGRATMRISWREAFYPQLSAAGRAGVDYGATSIRVTLSTHNDDDEGGGNDGMGSSYNRVVCFSAGRDRVLSHLVTLKKHRRRTGPWRLRRWTS